MTPITRTVLDFLRENKDRDFTAEEIAKNVGLTTEQVNGNFTASFVRIGLGKRVFSPESKKIKYLKLTPYGMTYEEEE